MKRAISLDAFRGYAIVMMVLSGTIASNVLPAWMYHAQVGPRTGYNFDPTLYGITWVDLVFPFFLFALGAAIPFSIGGKLDKGERIGKVIGDCVLRGLQLTFFAIFIQHMYPWATSSPQDTDSWLLSIGAFILMFPMFMRIPMQLPAWVKILIEVLGYAVGVVLLFSVDYNDGRSFDLACSDIIILVLANMAFWGSIVYLFTRHNPWLRIGILPFLLALFLGSSTEHSWQQAVVNFSPVPWLYHFNFLKYLFVVIPGTIAGEYLKEWIGNRTQQDREQSRNSRLTLPILLISVGIVIVNLYGLYTRQILLNLFLTVLLLSVLGYLLRNMEGDGRCWRKLWVAGAYLLMLGLFFEAYEGGIRKDYATYSYYFVSSGLAFLSLLAFSIIGDVYTAEKGLKPLVMAGKNPMIAYVGVNLVVNPLLNLTGLMEYVNLLNENAWLGFLRGVLLTSVVVAMTMFFSKLKWFWRT